MNDIHSKAPKGATHYFKNEFIVSYFFYSNDVELWFVWDKHFEYWSSKIFMDRIKNLKKLN
jgi:hypothetical protein